MRKQTKIAALVSAAALLAIGASMTSFAYGWNFDGEEWEWLDRDGNRVTETWKTSGGNYYWLDENGIMATDELIEDDGNWYYVDENGVRVSNQWKDFENDNDVSLTNGDEVDVVWYYFGDNGKAYKADDDLKAKTVSWNGQSKRFIFDTDGIMQSGWVEMTDNKGNKDYYWCGDETEGWIHTGWQYLEPSEFIMGDTAYDDQEWFHFKSNGKVRKAGKPGAVITEYIGGKYYSFDHNGVLQDDWFSTSTTVKPQTATLNEASGEHAFANVDGAKTGWVYTNRHDDEDEYAWYYLVKENGYKTVPFNLNNPQKAYAARIINGKTYMFNEKGAMVSGIVKVLSVDDAADPDDPDDAELPADDWHWLATPGQATGRDGNLYVAGAKKMGSGIYYFSEAAASQGKDGRMMTGKQTVTVDGEKFYYNFQKNGQAYVAEVKDNILYDINGRRIQAEEGNTYQIVKISDLGYPVHIGNGWYDEGSIIVTSSGKIKRTTRVTVDGVRYQLKDVFIDKAELVDGSIDTDVYLKDVVWEAPHPYTPEA